MNEMKKNNGRGGTRPGSGRKLKPLDRHRVQRQFSIHPEVSRKLDETIESGERSRFVNKAIKDSLKKFINKY
jgi:hypothetical protein